MANLWALKAVSAQRDNIPLAIRLAKFFKCVKDRLVLLGSGLRTKLPGLTLHKQAKSTLPI
jgi:hypothetical protein